MHMSCVVRAYVRTRVCDSYNILMCSIFKTNPVLLTIPHYIVAYTFTESYFDEMKDSHTKFSNFRYIS